MSPKEKITGQQTSKERQQPAVSQTHQMTERRRNGQEEERPPLGTTPTAVRTLVSLKHVCQRASSCQSQKLRIQQQGNAKQTPKQLHTCAVNTADAFICVYLIQTVFCGGDMLSGHTASFTMPYEFSVRHAFLGTGPPILHPQRH